MIEIMMLTMGLATHFVKAMMQSKIAGAPVTPMQYWKSHPYQTALCVIGAIVGYIALMESGNLEPLTAFGVGYMANSMADIIGGRAAKSTV